MARVLLRVQSIAASTAVPSTVGAAVGGASTTQQIPLTTEKVAVTAYVEYGVSATAGVDVKVYASADGVAWDTVPYQTISPALTAGQPVQQTAQVDCQGIAFIAVTANNKDAVVATRAIVVSISGL